MAIVRYVGLVEETEYNETPIKQADFHVDIASASLDAMPEANAIFEGGLGRMARLARPTYYAPEGDFAYSFDVDTVGYLLKFALGGYNFTNVAEGLNVHEVWGTNDVILPSFVTRVGKDLFEHVFTGCVLNTLELNVADEFCMANVSVMSAKDSKADIKAETDLNISEAYPLMFHEVTATRGASEDMSVKVKTLTLSINNNLDKESGKTIGSRHPRRIPANQREVTINMELFHEDTSELERYWGDSSGVDMDSDTFDLKLFFDGGEHGNMEIRLPKVLYTNVQTQPDGRAELTQTVEARVLADEVTVDGDQVVTDIVVEILNDEGEM